MVSDLACFKAHCSKKVLILVLMEYGLWQERVKRETEEIGLNPCSNGIWSLTKQGETSQPHPPVLILVLMEYGLWRIVDYGDGSRYPVLILVLMEYGLWLFCPTLQHLRCLNPCSNGIWSLTLSAASAFIILQCLNPCSNGIWSLTFYKERAQESGIGLNPCSNGIWSLTSPAYSSSTVASGLNPVLMEYGLWPSVAAQLILGWACLNPCSNGIWSLTDRCTPMWVHLSLS